MLQLVEAVSYACDIPVVRSTAGNSTGKEVRGMSQQVGCHKSPIGVAPNCYSAGIHHPSSLQLLQAQYVMYLSDEAG